MTRAKDISKILTDADISGNIDVDGVTNLDVVDIDGTLNVAGETTLQTHLNMGDDDKIKLGASGDLEIYHDTTNGNSVIHDTGSGNLRIRADDFQVTNASASANLIFANDSNGEVKLYHNGSEKIATTSGGVTVTGGLVMTSNDPTITMTDSSGTNDIGTIQSASGALIFTTRDGSADGEIIFKKTDGSATDETMRINSSGNVGIGTSSPSHLVDATVASGSASARFGTTHNSGANSGTVIIGNGGSGNAMLRFDYEGSNTDRARIGVTSSGQQLEFYTAGNNERMRIVSGGNVLVGTTNQSPAEGTGVGVRLGSNGTSQFSSNGDSGVSVNRTGDNGNVMTFRRDGNLRGRIAVDGNSTSYVTSSDYRLKESITYDFDATSRLKQLKPARFNFIADADTTVDGFLAHEVSSIVPEAISGKKDAMFAEVLYVDEDEIPDGKKVGDVRTPSQINPQGIDQAKLVPLLVKTIQELEARITALESA